MPHRPGHRGGMFDYGQFDQPNAFEQMEMPEFGAPDMMNQNEENDTFDENNVNPNRMSSMDFLQSVFGPLGVDRDRLSQFEQFVTPIPDELFDLTNPDADIYQQFRSDRQDRLNTQLGETFGGLQQTLFQGQRQARGMQGRRGFVSGRDVMSDMSQMAADRGSRAFSAFGRGLYDIEQNIVDRVGAERRYIAGLESQRRSDALRLAELAGLFRDEEDE